MLVLDTGLQSKVSVQQSESNSLATKFTVYSSNSIQPNSRVSKIYPYLFILSKLTTSIGKKKSKTKPNHQFQHAIHQTH